MAQYFQFTQYNFTSQRINPAQVASSDYATLSLDYRHQTTGGDANLNSSIVSATYPFLHGKSGKRWSGIGISVMDDRSGQGGIFNTQETSLSYALNIYLSRFQTFSLGAKGLYQQRKVNLDGLYTGSQYIPDRGFDGSVFNGENSGRLKNDFFTLSLGLWWQQTDRDDQRLAYWGLSFFDFNKPSDSFYGLESSLNSTFVATAGFRIYRKDNISVFPEVLYTRSASNNIFNAGAIIRYAIKPLPNQVTAHVDVITKYVAGRSGIIGLQLHRENFSIGFSYDFPVIKRNVSNYSAFEIGLELRKLVIPKSRNRKLASRKNNNSKPSAKKTSKREVVSDSVSSEETEKLNTDTTKTKQVVRSGLRESLQQKQDSIRANAEAGKIKHEPMVIEKVTLHFNFQFNSTEIDEPSTQYLQDLSEALNDAPHLKVKLTGHTDNIGSERFNQRLSLHRAESVKKYLIQHGVHPDRIVTDGRGMHEPMEDNETEAGRAKNRRVELTILYEN